MIIDKVKENEPPDELYQKLLQDASMRKGMLTSQVALCLLKKVAYISNQSKSYLY